MHDELIDQAALRDLVSRYCRAIDRHDWQALRDLYHPDAVDDHGAFYKGLGPGFPDAAASGLKMYDRHMHSVANSLFAINGDHAEGETYFFAVAQTRLPDAKHYQFGGRYLDRFERRNRTWRFIYRLVAHDWVQISCLASETREVLEAMGTVGRLDGDDASYATLPNLSAKAAAGRSGGNES